MTKIGERVVAIKSATKEKAIIFGKGVYVGDDVPLEAVGLMAKMIRDIGMKNPKIVLDDGSVVYGCECWWGPESTLDEYPTFELYSIDECRKEFENTAI